jgi:spermidine synthase
MARGDPFLYSAPAFFITAALVGSVLPLLCQVSISPDEKSGRSVSLVYLSNILGCAVGSLGIGFVLMQYFSLRIICLGLGFLAVAVGAWLFVIKEGRLAAPRPWSVGLIGLALVAIPVASGQYKLLFERLIFGHRPEANVPFAHVVENRNGVIGVTGDGAVFGGGVYDGYFNVDPMNDVNLVARIYALGAFCPHPRRILVIGLASASWAQILVNHPEAEALDAVEINPGYVPLIKQYPMVQSFLTNPKVHLYIDDGRRWLLAHPGMRYDAIIANTTYNWRDHSTTLQSVEYLNLIRSHLEPGGVYYFNSTESDDTFATALHVFPHGLRVINFGAVSDSPITIDTARWLRVLREYTIDGKPVFEPSDSGSEKVLAAYMALAESIHYPPRFLGMETDTSLRARLGKRRIITDDNMGEEWLPMPKVPWH